MHPEVFTRPPSHFSTGKSGQLTAEQVKQFFEEGFLIVPHFFSHNELEPVFEAIKKLVDDLAKKLYDAGKIKNKHEDATFYQRLSKLEQEFPGAAVLLHKGGILPKAFQDLWSNERLLNVVEQFIGPEIAGNPVWNLRTKTPNNPSVTVPWHQDNAYLSEDAANVFMPAAWIPLLDAKRENGCLQVARYGHKKCVLAKHTCCAGPTWYVDLDEEEMRNTLGIDMEKDVVTCELPLGGIVFLNNIIPHRSLENFSDKVRWSLDLRWQKAGEPACFHNLKDTILMRTSSDPNYKPNWEAFVSVDRTTKQEDHYTKMNEEEEVMVSQSILVVASVASVTRSIVSVTDPSTGYEEFDTRIIGPWMARWEITHHNKNTSLFMSNPGELGWHKS